MRVYVVMVNDRHADPEPTLFSVKEDALSYARSVAYDWLEEQDDTPDDWLFYAKHESESDSIWVIEKELES